MKRTKKILVNAIPLINIHTGISRYLKCLYASMEQQIDQQVEIWYFDGVRISKNMPTGPRNRKAWAKEANWFWTLPWPLALLFRLTIHFWRELTFRKAVSNMDLYHEAGFFPYSVPYGVKVVFTLHDLSLYRFPQYHPRERVWYSRLFLKRRCRCVNRFLAVSRFTREEAVRVLGITRDQIKVTHLAHDAAVFYPRFDLDRPLILNGERLPERYFLFVGSGDPRKNLEVVPAALEKTGLSIPLVTVGWSGWWESMQGANILQLGYLPDADLAQVYSRATALIFPSEYEGFGLPLLEAMACGCPVITTRNASIPEVTGDAALLMDHPLDIMGLSRLLNRLAQDQVLSELLRNKGIAQAARFSWETTASATWEAFQQILTNPSSN